MRMGYSVEELIILHESAIKKFEETDAYEWQIVCSLFEGLIEGLFDAELGADA
jgi:hypothetical protein